MKSNVGRSFLAAVFLWAAVPAARADSSDPAAKEATLEKLDFNGDGMLDAAEIDAGLQYQLDDAYNQSPRIDLASYRGHPEKARARMRSAKGQIEILRLIFQKKWGSPPYSIGQLAANPEFMPKREFSLEVSAPPAAGTPKPAENTAGLQWKLDDKPHIFRVRRTIDDFNNDRPDTAKGALISYASDFNSHSQQWAVHGVVGLNLTLEEQLGIAPAPVEGAGTPAPAPVEQTPVQGYTEVWFRPSVALDKVNTSRGAQDEVDALVFRAALGGFAVGDPVFQGLFEGYQTDLAASFATDTNGERKVFAGELNVQPFRTLWKDVTFGVNAGKQKAFHNPVLWISPELVFHAEGGTVIDNAHIAVLRQQADFLRLGGTVGLSFGPVAAESSPWHFVTRLTLHTSFEYGVNVVSDSPDVDLFIASADWKIDPDGHYTFSAEYRNGRSALVLQRDNRVTLGLGIKY